MYEPSRHIDTFFIAGFQHYDGALTMVKLKPGKKIDLVAQPDNPYDAEAVALKRKGTMLGYVPKGKNGMLSVMLRYGHANAFECRVLQVDPEASPWEQVRVGIYVTDARD